MKFRPRVCKYGSRAVHPCHRFSYLHSSVSTVFNCTWFWVYRSMSELRICVKLGKKLYSDASSIRTQDRHVLVMIFYWFKKKRYNLSADVTKSTQKHFRSRSNSALYYLIFHVVSWRHQWKQLLGSKLLAICWHYSRNTSTSIAVHRNKSHKYIDHQPNTHPSTVSGCLAVRSDTVPI